MAAVTDCRALPSELQPVPPLGQTPAEAQPTLPARPTLLPGAQGMVTVEAALVISPLLLTSSLTMLWSKVKFLAQVIVQIVSKILNWIYGPKHWTSAYHRYGNKIFSYFFLAYLTSILLTLAYWLEISTLSKSYVVFFLKFGRMTFFCGISLPIVSQTIKVTCSLPDKTH